MPPFVDDLVSYPNETRLLRILRNDDFWYPKQAPTRASSCAFCDTTKENSCLVVDKLRAEDFVKIAEMYPGSKLALITAGQAREHHYTVCDDPCEPFPGHVVICPPREVRNKDYIRMAKALALCSRIYQPVT